MKTLIMQIELTYDDDVMHGKDPDAIRWFHERVLADTSKIGNNGEDGDNLVLWSKEIGDEVGTVKVLNWQEKTQ